MPPFKLSTSLIVLLFIAFSLFNCQSTDTLFTQLSARQTGIDFNNVLEESDDFNVLKYGYFFNGGGVAAGDFNNDGRIDLFFTGNIRSNKLYLHTNDDGIAFEDVTEDAGVGGADGWNTGASVVDINNDGWLDIYVCRSAANSAPMRQNLLFVNDGKRPDGKVKFTNRAAEYGLADDGYSTQAAFFDYDRDGDLDCFLLNHSVQQYAGFSRMIADYKTQDNPDYRSKLYRNDFIDSTGRQTGQLKMKEITQASGLISNVLSFGLGVSITDFNNDGWPDMYISNDYNENDYLYINQHKNSQGQVTFKESIREAMGHTSLYSMGTDAADFNNDGHIDIVTLDMLPERNDRIKLTSGDDNYDKYQSLINAGFHHQTSRNMLHLNSPLRERGNQPLLAGEGQGVGFSEIGQLAGISNTDWSWSALFADFDNDGFKDLFVTNGYARDYTNMEFLKYSTDMQVANQQSGKVPTQMEIIDKMPSINEPNCIFRNKGDLTFEKKTNEWGFDHKNQSNGAIYADLDNDGDLDLVVSNVNEEAGIYQNNAQAKTPQNCLKINLKTPNEALKMGAKVVLFVKDKIQVQEFQPVRGFQSSMYVPLQFGLGKDTQIDSMVVTWMDGKKTILRQTKANQQLTVDYKESKIYPIVSNDATPTYFNLAALLPSLPSLPPINDFKIQPLLPQMRSDAGPCMAKGDINNDGREDVYIGGGRGQAGRLFLQTASGFVESKQADFKNTDSEDADAAFFDADGDKDLDLVVVSAGYALNSNDALLQPRLYLNQKGKFTSYIPFIGPETALFVNASSVAVADIDSDGDIDLFIGANCIPRRFPEAQASVLLENDGKGNFSIVKNFYHKSLVTAAVFSDINGDKKPDLLIVSEWSKPMVYLHKNGRLGSTPLEMALPTGLWKSIAATDLDGDGDDDFVVGNEGQNSQFHVVSKDKLKLYYGDFGDNGSVVPVLSLFENGKEYPYASRDELLDQIPLFKKKYPDYLSYSKATLSDIFGNDLLSTTPQLTADELRTGILWNNNGKFTFQPLPIEAQFAPVNGVIALDVNKDGKKDLILAGNLDKTRVRLGKMDANKGQVFLNQGQRKFQYLPQSKSGINVEGVVKSVTTVGKYILFGRNNLPVAVYQFP